MPTRESYNPNTIRRTDKGIVTSGFQGKDYISLYWGDETGTDCVKELTDKQLEDIKESMRRQA